jgi:uncharacterized radical SAM superfamily protein
MPDVSTPEKLKRFCLDLDSQGGVGLLVSGGSTKEGRVPLELLIPTMRWVKENTGLLLEVHTGLLNREEAEELASTGMDIAALDVVGSNETIKRIYGLNASVDDYWITMSALKDAGVPEVAPHICVGLDYGEVKGEFKALELSAMLDPNVIVFLGLIPTEGTAMVEVPPPSIEVISKLISEATNLCPNAEISLGCMRSRSDRAEMEIQAILAGAKRIAMPSNKTIQKTVEIGYNIKILDGCCAIPVSMEDRALRG